MPEKPPAPAEPTRLVSRDDETIVTPSPPRSPHEDGDETVIIPAGRPPAPPPPPPPPPPAGPSSGGVTFGDLLVRNFRFAILVIVAVVLYGATVLLTLPRTEDPEFDVLDCKIVTLFPGADAEKVEDIVSEPLEEALDDVEGVVRVRTQSSAGLSILSLELDWGLVPSEIVDDVREKVRTAAGAFPGGVGEPEVLHFNAGDIPVLILSLQGPFEPHELADHAEWLKKRFFEIPAVSRVVVEGEHERRIRVDADPDRLAQYRVPLTRIRDVLAAENAGVPGGRLDVGASRFLLRSPNEIAGPGDVGDVVLGADGDALVYVRDVARVTDGYADPRYLVRTNGEPAVLLTVHKLPNTDTSRVSTAVLERLESLRAEIPDELRVTVISDRGRTVADLLGELNANALSGAALVMLTVGLFLGVRQGFVVVTSIFFSVMLALVFMDAAGIDLNQISIFGLALALGMVVDASLVVVENVTEHHHRGEPIAQAVTLGVNEVNLPVMSSTLTTIAAFVPLLFLGGDSGQFIRSMPLTLTFALVASNIVAVTVIPLLVYALWRSAPAETKTAHELPFAEAYSWLARFALRNRLLSLAVMIGLFVFAVRSIPGLGLEFFPKAEKKVFLIDVRLPRGASFEATRRFTERVEAVLAAEPAIRDYTVNVGKGSPQVYYNLARENERPNYAQVLVNLKESGTELAVDVAGRIEAEVRRIGGATVQPKILQQGPASEAAVEVRLVGEDRERLARASREVRARLEAIPGVVDLRDDVGDPVPRLVLDLDKRKAAALSVSSYAFARTVFLAVNGEDATDLRFDDEEVPVRVGLDPAHVSAVEDLGRLYVPAASGAVVPFAEIASVGRETAFAQLNRRDGSPAISVQMDVSGRRSNEVEADVARELAAYEPPEGVALTIGGENEERAESFAGLRQAMGLALGLIYAILALQFNSLIQPLVILATIPFGIIGAVFGLWISGNPFGFMAFIGIIGLSGIVINDSILLTDYANFEQRVNGRSKFEALLLAGRRRLQPVLLTSVTTVVGLAPLAIWGGSLWAPLANALMFGLIFSTVLILVLIPVIYSLLVPGTERRRRHRLVPHLVRRLFGRA